MRLWAAAAVTGVVVAEAVVPVAVAAVLVAPAVAVAGLGSGGVAVVAPCCEGWVYCCHCSSSR